LAFVLRFMPIGQARAGDIGVPDRLTNRIFLDDLRDETIRARLASIWTDPHSLNPASRAAEATRDIAARLAFVTKALEARNYNAEDVALFLMRCIFTMFAEDVGLLPKNCFTDLLTRSVDKPDRFTLNVKNLWDAMDKGGDSIAIDATVRRFNGELFKSTTVFPLEKAEIGELLAAAGKNWREVEPAIFGTLLEQALDPKERARLGAHFTPRPYVERLVEATIMEPLREQWDDVLRKAEAAKAENDDDRPIGLVRKFHHELCTLRVLDPACGTGNFLYVSLDLMKRLEGEVLTAMEALGGQAALGQLLLESVTPQQYLGLELNPRAAGIADLVLWIGHLQQHFRNAEDYPADPVLQAYGNIKKMDAVLTWDGYPVPKVVDHKETYPNPRQPAWPVADYIVGNPPFIGGKDIRAQVGDGYVEALWKAHKAMNDSADFVMYWWDRAAQILTAKKSPLKRFGFVTTNSITQVFQRKVVERHMAAKAPVSVIFAVSDHPWTKATKDAASVRIAMTVARAGTHDGKLLSVVRETGLDSDAPLIEVVEALGRVNSDFTVGVDVTRAQALRANEGLSSRGVVLHGAGFIVTPAEAAHLGLGTRSGLDRYIRPYRNGRDLMGHGRGVMVIDLFGLSESDVRTRFPEVYQHLYVELKTKTTINSKGEIEYVGRDWNNREYRRLNWWLFGENVPDARKALADLPRYIVTVETSKHRVFQFLDASILPDNKLIAIGSANAFDLGILASKPHYNWYIANSGMLGVYDKEAVYVKSRCFDPFPLPDATPTQQATIAAIAEELDATRKSALAENPDLTMTGLYNLLERVRGLSMKNGVSSRTQRSEDAGPPVANALNTTGSPIGASLVGDDTIDGREAMTPTEADQATRGRVYILQHLHDRLDAAVADAYGWPADLSEQEVLGKLVALNLARRAEEATGKVRWLRPDYQAARFGRPDDKRDDTQQLDLGVPADKPADSLPVWPKDRDLQPFEVERAVRATAGDITIPALARTFKGGGKKIEPRLTQVLAVLADYGRIQRAGEGRYRG
jgi:hypothetical protein